MDKLEKSTAAGSKRIQVKNKELEDKLCKLKKDLTKITVFQDSAYWDLRQKLVQVEGNHERLQLNMIALQMEHESVSSQYQEELRQRPEILNKLNSTRAISEVLEESIDRLKQTVSRCNATQISLAEAYQTAEKRVLDIKKKQEQSDDKHQQIIHSLIEKVNKSEEHQLRLANVFNMAKQQLERELTATREQLNTIQAGKRELKQTIAHLNEKLNAAHSEIHQRDQAITSLNDKVLQMNQECMVQIESSSNATMILEKNLQQATEANAELKNALAEEKQYSINVVDQKTLLEEKIRKVEDENAMCADQIVQLKQELEEANSNNNIYKQEVSQVKEENAKLAAELTKKDEQENTLKDQLNKLNGQILGLEQIKKKLFEDLNSLEGERENYIQRIQEIISEKASLDARLDELDQKYTSHRVSTDQVIQDLTQTIENNKKELDMKTSAASGLLSDLQSSTDNNNKLKSALQKCKKELEEEKDRCREMEIKFGMQVENLSETINDKEREFSKQMALIRDMRNEKERLLERINDMQVKMDNVQKELTRCPEVREPVNAERPNADDSLMYPANTQDSMGDGQRSPVLPSGKSRQGKFAEPQLNQRDQMQSLVSVFSDSSIEEIDIFEKRRRMMSLSRGNHGDHMKLPPKRFKPANEKDKQTNPDDSQVIIYFIT
ncbi:unnamed protein product [Leptosia nina]|uniref:Uncharacterized protein n=1 Tax=Leptosia nina TaxID=320188 RepID=A0AAV1JEE5_9NEOP